MGRKLFIGNLPYSADNAQLGQAFAVHGEVISAVVVTDRETQRSRGFGFVELATEDAARTAMQALDGSPLGGRNITVREAEERKRPPMGEARSRPMETRAPRTPSYEGGGQSSGGQSSGGQSSGGQSSGGQSSGGQSSGGGAGYGGAPAGGGPSAPTTPGPVEEARGAGRGSKRGDDDRRRRHDDWDDE